MNRLSSISRLLVIAAAAVIVAACGNPSADADREPSATTAQIGTAQAAEQQSSSAGTPSVEHPYVQLPAIDAYCDGEVVWFIHTESSDEMMAKMLTEMVDYPTLHAAALGEIAPEKAAKIYVFTNGIDRTDAKPWGGGPFHYQIDVFDSVPGDAGYSPLRNPHRVTWGGQAQPRVLKTEQEILEAEQKGELTIEPTKMIVNAPIVDWPGRRELMASNE